ncbi:ferrous iron transporter B [Adlercreutzia sp. ZJ141]|uniref:ferrous iron transporter B n=1 Tax=Adlercreutzia sp. ZJ141 TaxID=2709406 RepID=UPI0013E9FCA3|nr:ferrous iron transporter B [Adlercreutzia sp. ZJ141]
MTVRIALAGNPNSGKTTMFNELTGANQYVGNWPGVTVEKKEGKYTKDKDVTITDLPGVYSLSPYSPEEIVTRDYLLDGNPDVVINLVDATNLERNLYLTTQIIDLGVPVVVALNMMDLVEKAGDKVDVAGLSKQLGCPVIETSALKSRGLDDVVKAAIAAGKRGSLPVPTYRFSDATEEAIGKIIDIIGSRVKPNVARWFAIKALEGEQCSLNTLSLSAADMKNVDVVRASLEHLLDDDIEGVIAGERYDAITDITITCVKKTGAGMTLTQKIDRVVTNRWAGLPIFVVVMALVYYIAVTLGGGVVTDWANDGISGDGWLYTGGAAYEEAVGAWEEEVAAAEAAGDTALAEALAEEEPDPSDGSWGLWIPGLTPIIGGALEAIGAAGWVQSLVLDGIVAGVGAVIGFIPQMILLFLMLAFLEHCGYMARVAFMMDRIFRKFGLSGKSFIPILIGSGCGVPAVMATKTIENESDRRMTVMTTTMIPCGAKMPIIALVFGALAGGDMETARWVAPLFYFLGVIAIIVSGIMLKKLRVFAGEATPFIMELPQYHLPAAKSVALATWDRVKHYIVKAGTIIFLSTIVIWFLMNFGVYEGSFGLLDAEMDGYLNYSFMAMLGNALAWIFVPLGFGDWQATVTSVTGLVAKENVVATVGVLTQLGELGETDPTLWEGFALMFGGSTSAILAFTAFNLLCAPCFAAIGAIRNQMRSAKWTWATIGYMTGFGWCVGLMLRQFVGLATGEIGFSVWTVLACVVAAGMIFQLVRPMPDYERIDALKAAKKLSADKSAA